MKKKICSFLLATEHVQQLKLHANDRLHRTLKSVQKLGILK